MRDWFIKDLGWKLFSVFLALAIWLTVHKILDEGMGSPAILVRGVERTCDDLPVLIVSSAADVRDFHVRPAAVAVKNALRDIMSPPLYSPYASQVRKTMIAGLPTGV